MRKADRGTRAESGEKADRHALGSIVLRLEAGEMISATHAASPRTPST
jgi:hypothetical protein